MMNVDEVKKLLEPAFPDAQINVSDMTGTQDHFQIEIVSETFQGKMMVAQHQMVQKPLKAALDDGRIHAIMIKTYTPEQRKNESDRGDELHTIG